MPNLNFDRYNTLYATHGLHAYAAKCPPQLVKYGISYYSKRGDTVLDPMVGSGTTLVEARLMGRHAIGYDLDPLAQLISQVKSHEVDDIQIQQAYDKVISQTLSDLTHLQTASPPADVCQRAVLPEFHNRSYWFSSEVATILTLLSHHIDEIEMPEEVRAFLWVAFSSLILAKKSVANARDITHSRHHYWQHPQPPDVLKKFSARIKRMRKQMSEFQERCRKAPTVSVESYLGDARNLPLEDETIDLIFTSPPYATALDYPRAHFLAVAWMEKVFGINLEEYRRNAPAYIGSEKGRIAGDFVIDEQLNNFALMSSVLTELSSRSTRNAKLIQRYFVDMYQVLGEMNRTLKKGKHAIIVVCPSHIRKIDVPTHKIFAEMGKTIGLRLKKEYIRTINNRRRILPYMQKEFGQRMSTEYVLIFQKI